ncbi:hypothetical protein IscW_ISCW013105 [Ixodes scapularis]|uniref:Uncharacterized protein n=1 Tax=Ixodes scapularis TaxID=6945 RepID=B7QBM7_IXOSC|nr:hypothetical protein IscW_ISCW013105 [Ixodes scapularis]|eukprot:XP_002400852.1 hypothetical protein IscW_ISCW013105 [Ixodes scapularis]
MQGSVQPPNAGHQYDVPQVARGCTWRNEECKNGRRNKNTKHQFTTQLNIKKRKSNMKSNANAQPHQCYEPIALHCLI